MYKLDIKGKQTDGLPEELANTFGVEVARIVEVNMLLFPQRRPRTDDQECTDPHGLSGNEAKAEQVRTAPYKSREAQQVKLAEYVYLYLTVLLQVIRGT
jgi:guanosine-3',5'-bis(diphosphate) 3'-pyrophosphohydrolase